MRDFDDGTPETWSDYPEYYRHALSMFCTHPSDMETRRIKQKLEEEWQAKETCGQIPPRKRKPRIPFKPKDVLQAEATEFRQLFLDWAKGMPFEIELPTYYDGRETDYFILRAKPDRRVDIKTGDWLFSVTYWNDSKSKAVGFDQFDHREVGMKMPDEKWYKETSQRIADFLLNGSDK